MRVQSVFFVCLCSLMLPNFYVSRLITISFAVTHTHTQTHARSRTYVTIKSTHHTAKVVLFSGLPIVSFDHHLYARHTFTPISSKMTNSGFRMFFCFQTLGSCRLRTMSDGTQVNCFGCIHFSCAFFPPPHNVRGKFWFTFCCVVVDRVRHGRVAHRVCFRSISVRLDSFFVFAMLCEALFTHKRS